MMMPASLLRKGGYAVSQAHPYAVRPEVLTTLDPDVVVFQQFMTDKQVERIKVTRQALPNAFLVYEVDDLFWAVPEGSYHRNNPLLPESKSRIRTAAKLCDAVTVTTEALADEMRKLTGMKDVRVLPNLVPNSFINSALDGRRSADAKKSDKPRVGWAGGIGHGGDLKIIATTMQEFGDEVQWVFFGMLPDGVAPGPNVEFYKGVKFENYPRMLGTMNLDLALAPLEDNDFNRCKSDLRVLEYGAAGFPVLASDISTYEKCPVARCANTVEDWVKMIRHLLSAPLDVYAENLHKWVTTTRCLDGHLAERAAAYLPPKSTPFVPMASASHIGHVVAVGAVLDGMDCYASMKDAWAAAPGADVLYVRPQTHVTGEQVARLIMALGDHASAVPMCNDGIYPTWGKFTRIDPGAAASMDIAAQFTGAEPIPCPFPAGPCVLLAGHALARFGLPDETRFGSAEYAMADWGARCMEAGKTHITVLNTYVTVDAPLVQPKDIAQRTMDHISMWSPGFMQLLQNYQQGPALLGARNNLDLAYHALSFRAPPIPDYPTWSDVFEGVNKEDRRIMSKSDVTETGPLISIVMPTYDTPENALREALDSVLAQTYPKWELLIADDASTEPHVKQVIAEYLKKDTRILVTLRDENGHIVASSNDAINIAAGDWVCFLDHDDTLAPQAMWMLANEIVSNPDAKFIYSDSDKISPTGVLQNPYFTPDFSYELLLAQNYVTHLCAYRLPEVKALGGLKAGTEGSQDWDLVLRYLDAECGSPPDPKLIRHIPHVLYHWRESENSTSYNVMSKPYAIEAGRKAVIAHFNRIGQSAFVGPHPVIPNFNLVRFPPPDPAPKVTIIIPTKDNAAQLDRCLGSVINLTLYPNFDILVLDNGSTDKHAMRLLTQLMKHKNVRVLRMPGEFNYSEMNNRAVARTDAEFVCLMNDDVEVIERAWLNDMVGLAARPKVGAVGAKLIYPNDTVQEGGIMFSATQPPGQCALHMWQQLPMHDVGQTGRAVITAPCIAVTGACLVIKKDRYEEIGGLDAIRFPVDWNDVDFCLRLHKKGYRNIYAAQSYMRHHEGQTKKRLNTWTGRQMLADEQKLLALHGDVVDPYINPRLVFHPHLTQLSQMPHAKPWGDTDPVRRLYVNGNDALALQAYKDGYLPYVATVEGHYLVFSAPAMGNVLPIDLRRGTDAFETAIAKLGITEIVFCGIGDGTLGTVGFFAAVASNGWRIIYEPTKEAGTDNDLGYYDAAGWRAGWQGLLDATQLAEAAD